MKSPASQFPLPVLRDEPPVKRQRRRWLGLSLHTLRVAMFAALLWLIHDRHQQFLAREAARDLTPIDLEQLIELFPTATSTGEVDPDRRTQTILDNDQRQLGFVLQTSPDSDHIVGFSGPTNVLIAFRDDETIAGVSIIRTRDTREHAALVERNESFLSSWQGLTWEEASSRRAIDAVSGATLTSLAIAESIQTRLRGNRPTEGAAQEPPNLRFPSSPTVADVAAWYPTATSVEWSSDCPGQYDVLDRTQQLLGRVFRTTPAADAIIGYQGPTDTLVGLDVDGRVIGIRLNQSFDNEKYVGYVRDEDYFLNLFNGKSISDLAEMDLFTEQVEGVSGATMTSMAVAESLIAAAKTLQQKQTEHDAATRAEPAASATKASRTWTPSPTDISVVLLVVFAILFSQTRLRSHRRLRIIFQVVLVLALGFWAGALTSLATFFGWAQSGVPWQFASGLTIITASALLFPAFSRSQLYCHHVCPHGALQQLLRNRLPGRWRPRDRSRSFLLLIPFLILLVAVIATLLDLPLSLVDLEPFDAYVLQAAGVATLTIFGIGLAASLFIPMAYCRFGCPTGAILEFLRFNSASDRWTVRDSLAAGLLGLSTVLWLVPLPPDDGHLLAAGLIGSLTDIVNSNRTLLKWLAIGSALTFIGSLAAVPWLVGLIPDDYFHGRRRPHTAFHGRHPVVAVTLRIAKNLLGAIFLLAGLAMLVLPGQGLLTVLVGVVLLEFPGKRRLERALVRRQSVLRAINWIRRRRGRPEIRLD